MFNLIGYDVWRKVQEELAELRKDIKVLADDLHNINQWLIHITDAIRHNP